MPHQHTVSRLAHRSAKLGLEGLHLSLRQMHCSTIPVLILIAIHSASLLPAMSRTLARR